MTVRHTRETASHPEVVMAKPVTAEIKLKLMKKEQGSCFGQAWDAAENDCAMCADSELCCILMRDTLKVKEKELEKKSGAIYLDRADFTRVNKEAILRSISREPWTTQELIDEVMAQAQTSDEIAAVEWIKRFKKEGKFKIKHGKVELV